MPAPTFLLSIESLASLPFSLSNENRSKFCNRGPNIWFIFKRFSSGQSSGRVGYGSGIKHQISNRLKPRGVFEQRTFYCYHQGAIWDHFGKALRLHYYILYTIVVFPKMLINYSKLDSYPND